MNKSAHLLNLTDQELMKFRRELTTEKGRKDLREVVAKLEAKGLLKRTGWREPKKAEA